MAVNALAVFVYKDDSIKWFNKAKVMRQSRVLCLKKAALGSVIFSCIADIVLFDGGQLARDVVATV